MERSAKIALIAGGSFFALAGLAFIFRKQTAKYLLDAHHEKHIEKLHPGVQDIFRQFIDEVEKKGWAVFITRSYHTHADQQRLIDEGNSQAVQPGNSPHQYGFALDINLQKGLKWIKMASSNSEWEATGAPSIARRLGLRWGGDFTGKNKGDRVHFDKWLLPVNQMKLLAQQQFGTNPANIKGNRIKIV